MPQPERQHALVHAGKKVIVFQHQFRQHGGEMLQRTSLGQLPFR